MSEVRGTADSSIIETTMARERTWAAIAHASSIVTLLLAFPTMGLGGLLTVWVPLAIYLVYKDKSDYVAFHAAQALALQVAGTAGYFVAIVAAIIAWTLAVVVVALLSVILIGLILVPVLLVLTLALLLGLLLAPFVLGGFALVAAVQTAGGESYHYPYLGRWVADRLARTRQRGQAPPVV